MRALLVQWGSGLYPKSLLFDPNPKRSNSYYSIPHLRLRNELAKFQIEVLPHESFGGSFKADCLISLDLPQERYQIEELIDHKVKPEAPLLLIAMESAHSRPELYSFQELKKWNHVFHYSHLLSASGSLSRYFLPSNLPHLRMVGPDFCHDRIRLVGMAGTNKASRIANVSSWPIVRSSSGYSFSLSDCARWLSMRDGLRLRRYWAHHLADLIPDEFRVFGGQWDGMPYAPHHRIAKPQANPCATGHCLSNVISIMKGFRFFFATENFIGDSGYLTEKLFNVLRAGVVPIYHAESSHLIRKAAGIYGEFFIRLEDFSSPAALIDCLQSFDDRKYQAYLMAGKKFMASRLAANHLPSSYASFVSSRIAEICDRSTSK